MTPDDFRRRAEAAALPKSGAPQLGPIEIAVVIAALTTAVSLLVTHCLHRLLPEHARNPSLRQCLVLRWRFVRPAVHAALAERKDADDVDVWHVEGLVTQALVDTAKGLTDEEFAGLKASATGTSL